MCSHQDSGELDCTLTTAGVAGAMYEAVSGSIQVMKVLLEVKLS